MSKDPSTLEWRQQNNKLKVQALSLGLDLKSLKSVLVVSRDSLFSQEVQSLFEKVAKEEINRNKETQELSGALRMLRENTKVFKERLKDFSAQPEYLEELEKRSKAIDARLKEYKQLQKSVYQKLIDEEKTLTHDLNLFSGSLDKFLGTHGAETQKKKYSEPPKAHGSLGNQIEENYQDSNSPLKKEKRGLSSQGRNSNEEFSKNQPQLFYEKRPYKKLEKKLQETKEEIDRINGMVLGIGGKTCGWADADHSDFLRVRTQHKNIMNTLAFVNDALCVLPLYSQQDIIDHINAFSNLLVYEDKKKFLLNEYKRLKGDLEKEKIKAMKEDEELQEELNQKNKKQREKSSEAAMKEEKKRKELEEWKKARQIQNEIQEERKKLEEMKAREEAEWRKWKENETKKEKVKEFKEKKEIMKQVEEKKKEVAAKPIRPSSSDLKRIKEREEEILLRKKELSKAKEIKQRERQKRIESAKGPLAQKYLYVEGKLLSDTPASQNKQREKFNPQQQKGKEASTLGGVLLQAQGRAIPVWRQNLI